MKFDIHQEENYAILTPLGEKLDSTVAPDLKSNIIILSQADDTGHLILDLTAITFADSSGLSALLLAHRLYRDSGRKLVLCGLTERVIKLLEISKLTTTFTIAPDSQEAESLVMENSEE